MIENLFQYTDALHACSMGIFSFDQAVKSAVINLSDVQPYASWDQKSYTRTTLEQNEDFELLLLCWEPGQSTVIHDHNGQQGWIHIIQGELTEETFDIQKSGGIPSLKSKTTFKPGEVSYRNDDIGVYRIENTSHDKSISLHLYVKPIDRFQSFNAETGAISNLILESKRIA